LLIVGIGSILMGDDGAGIEVINRLGQIKLPENVELLNAGLDSFGLLGKLEGRKKHLEEERLVRFTHSVLKRLKNLNLCTLSMILPLSIL